jgi:hypothetical protein
MTITFKDHAGAEHDFASLPETTQRAMVSRAVSHILGNECASLVVGRIRKHIAETSEPKRKADSVKADEISAFRESHPQDVAGWLSEVRDVKLGEMFGGSLGMRVASAIDPVGAEMTRLARDEIQKVFKASGLKFPRKRDETFEIAGQAYNADELVEAWMSGTDDAGMFGKPGDENEPRLRRQADRNVKAKNDQAKTLATKASTGGLAASLGLGRTAQAAE